MLLANKKIVISLFYFFKATQIGAKKVTKKLEKKWRRKNDQVEEKLFIYRQWTWMKKCKIKHKKYVSWILYAFLNYLLPFVYPELSLNSRKLLVYYIRSNLLYDSLLLLVLYLFRTDISLSIYYSFDLWSRLVIKIMLYFFNMY